ncbi:N-acetylmuramoyl-L-alanine amidase [Amycolatopsis sp. FU40]|uniref:peptidoglycan recognition protein family protein n=1 Tax=Amycolatopsis sp. FU40 TaxID=2914159 RepID=UPI001F2D27B4|nr:N-acetylmuramoyl-L-alanine amidase [Amycolatopsis sp. FU40]UKD55166.1 N-acetylmuramoyl-L-alanine amidase [Amycolatopsis sp. FU40]
MYLTSLATIARSAGLKVVEQPGWQTRGHGQMAGVQCIVCHHTATPATAPGNYPSLGIVTNGRSDLPGPLCNYGLGRDGTVYVVAAGVAWHAGAVLQSWQQNQNSIGIEAESDGGSAWPEVQLDAYARLCRALCAAFGLPVSRVLGHKEVCSPHGRKNDPNFDMSQFRARVAVSNDNTTTTGGFLMALSEADQKFILDKVHDIDATLGAVYVATGGKQTFGPAFVELKQRVDWLYSVLANTPDLNKDGKQGDVSLVNWRQWQADQEAKQTAALDEIRAQLADLTKKLGA